MKEGLAYDNMFNIANTQRKVIMMSFINTVGIDIGTSHTRVYTKKKGVISEPSVLAIDVKMDTVLAVGAQAHEMIGMTPGSMASIRPIHNGVIADFDIAATMLKYRLKKAAGVNMFARPYMLLWEFHPALQRLKNELLRML